MNHANYIRIISPILLALAGCLHAADEIATKPVQRFVTVEENVKLEVVDWGGTGRPLVLLAGLGNDAHVFDEFSQKLTTHYHVYGITRRGFGASNVPKTGYSSERLGEDVIAVLKELKLQRPILVGHSIAGSELSYIASSHSNEVGGLIYLDAAYAYALYDPSTGDPMNLLLDSIELKKQLEDVPFATDRMRQLVPELLKSVQLLEADLHVHQELQKILPHPPKTPAGAPNAANPSPTQLILAGLRKYSEIPVPVLAIFASPLNPEDVGHLPPAAVQKFQTVSAATADAFEKRVPSAHVVRIARASHFIFKSNETDVVREMDQFIGQLAP